MNFAKRMLLVNEDYLNMLRKHGADTAEPEKQGKEQTILATLPKTFRSKGEALISLMKDNGITMDEKQQLVINEKPVSETNFTDLVHDLLRYRAIDPPHGFETLARALKSINVSRELITNLDRYKYIADIDREIQQPDDVKPADKTIGPIRLRRVTKRPRVIIPKRGWVAW